MDYSGFGVGDATQRGGAPRQPAAAAGRDPGLRAVPRAARADHRRARLRQDVPRQLPPGASRRRPLLRRRADPGRGVRVRVVHAEQDVRGGRDLLGLPQRAQPEAARHRATTCAATATCRSPTTRPAHHHHKQGTDAALCRELPHADDHLHGGGPALRPLDARAAGGLLHQVRHPERLHDALPRGQEPDVGERRRREVVRADADARATTTSRRSTPPAAACRTRSARCAPWS